MSDTLKKYVLWFACTSTILLIVLFFQLPEKQYSLDRNNLDNSTSPYLTQHANNPVNWQMWHEQTFSLAKQLNKPVFLSIGYATCYWCHVMERESFSDNEVAAALNKHFISIKVDREEQPNIDHLYMEALQIIKGEGGWPVNAFLTPNGDVFFIDSYIPKRKLIKLANNIAKQWQNNQSMLQANADLLTKQIQASLQFTPLETANSFNISSVIDGIKFKLDMENGGLQGAPKFPNETLLSFLLDYAVTTADEELLNYVFNSLSTIASSGLYDHVSGGFHRYAIDNQWHTPHFEKMLYNQGLLLSLYSKAYKIQPSIVFRNVIEQTTTFLLEEFSENNLFYAAMDAESDHREGVYYVFDYAQIESLLPTEHKALLLQVLDISPSGNFQNKNIIRLKPHWKSILQASNISEQQWQIIWAPIRQQLINIRKQRNQPFIDKKNITGWNALAIKGLLDASTALNNKQWQTIAEQAILKLESQNKLNRNNLARYSINEQVAKQTAQLEDYAFIISMLITAYDIDKNRQFLIQAEKWADKIITDYINPDSHTFNSYNLNNKTALNNSIVNFRDDNFPSAQATTLQVFNQLYQRTKARKYKPFSFQQHYLPNSISKQPEKYSSLLNSFNNGNYPSKHYFANGYGSVNFLIKALDEENQFQITANIELDKGWHINSNQPNIKEMKATDFLINNQVIDNYPPAKIMQLGFAEFPLSIWEGNIKLEQQITLKNEQSFITITLNLQSCSDELCLAPENIQGYLYKTKN